MSRGRQIFGERGEIILPVTIFQNPVEFIVNVEMIFDGALVAARQKDAMLDACRARFIDDPKGVTPQRLEMGTYPEGSNIIPNSFNRIPGFNYKNVYFVPGFPQMAWPMIDWVLDTHYKHLFDANRIGESAIIVREAGESLLIDLMKAVQGKYAEVKVFSLPRVSPERFIELGARGNPAQVEQAIAELKAGVTAMNFPWVDAPKFGG